MENHYEKEILHACKPFLRRLRLKRALSAMQNGLLAGVILALVIQVLAFFIPIENTFLYGVVAVAAGLVLGFFIGLLAPQDKRKTASEIDKLGFSERVQTMWQLRNINSTFASIQREDTMKILRKSDAKEKVRFHFSRQKLIGIVSILVAASILFILPSPQDDAILQKQNQREVMSAQAQELEKMMADVEKDKAISEIERNEINKKLAELAKELRKSKNNEEAIKKLSQMQQDIKKTKNQKTQQALDKMKQAAAKQQELASLAEALDQSDEEKTEQAKENIKKAAKDQAKADEMKEALKETLEQMQEGEWKEALEKLQEAIESGDEEALAEALEALQELDAQGSGDSASGSLAQVNTALQISKLRLAQSGSQGQMGQIQIASNSPGGQNSGQGQNGQGQGQSQGSGQGQGQGQGGKGAGSGAGTSGSGQNEGINSGSNGSGQAGTKPGDPNRVKDFEKIFDPSRLGGEGEQTQVTDDPNQEGPRIQAETQPGEGSLDGYIPYTQVVSEYQQQAVQAAREQQLPPALQSWIQAYFTALTQ